MEPIQSIIRSRGQESAFRPGSDRDAVALCQSIPGVVRSTAEIVEKKLQKIKSVLQIEDRALTGAFLSSIFGSNSYQFFNVDFDAESTIDAAIALFTGRTPPNQVR